MTSSINIALSSDRLSKPMLSYYNQTILGSPIPAIRLTNQSDGSAQKYEGDDDDSLPTVLSSTGGTLHQYSKSHIHHQPLQHHIYLDPPTLLWEHKQLTDLKPAWKQPTNLKKSVHFDEQTTKNAPLRQSDSSSWTTNGVLQEQSMIALQKEGRHNFALKIQPCEPVNVEKSSNSGSSSMNSSIVGYIDMSDMITEESPITMPRQKNSAVLLKIRRQVCRKEEDIIENKKVFDYAQIS